MSDFFDKSNMQCRACMCMKIKLQKFVPISYVDCGMKLHEMFKYIIPQIDIQEDDGLPQNVCFGCYMKMKNSYSFLQMCIANDKKYQEYYKLNPRSSGAITYYSMKAINAGSNCNGNEESVYVLPPSLRIERIDVKNVDSSVNETETNTPGNNEIFLEQPTTTLIASMKIKLPDEDSSDSDPLKSDNDEFNESAEIFSTKRKKVFKTRKIVQKPIDTPSDGMKHVCTKCGKSFNRKAYLRQHVLRHSEDRQFQCPDCPKNYTCRAGLAKHQVRHTKARNHICEICGKSYKRSYTLRKHMLLHTESRSKYKCEHCSIGFVNRGKLIVHLRTHTGEKPYKCKYCTRAFAQGGDLLKHLRLHLGEKIYKCNQCQEKFKYRADLQEHEFKHYRERQKESQTTEITKTEEFEITIVKEEPGFTI